MSHTVALHYWRYGVGGAERVTYALMEAFAHAGHDLVLYTDVVPAEGDYPVPAGVERAVVPATASERPAFWRREVEARGLDVMVYGSWLSDNAVTDCRSVHEAGCAVVYHTHGVSSYFMDKADGRRMLSTMCSCAAVADAVVTLSEADLPFWRALAPRVFAVPNPVDAYLSKVEVPTRTRRGSSVVWVGRMDPVEKRPDLAIRAFANLVEIVPDARLTMVGGGFPEVLEFTEALAGSLGVGDRVKFTGMVDDVTPYLLAADVLLMTSPTEGFPLSLAEAMHAGLPAVMFESPNLSLAEGCPGVLQVPWGDVRGLARALAEVLRTDRYAEMSQAARDRYRAVCVDVDLPGIWEGIISTALRHEGGTPPERTPETRAFLSLVQGYLRNDERVEAICSDRDAAIAERDAARAERDEALASLRAALEPPRPSIRESLSFLGSAVARRVHRELGRG